MNIPPSQIKLLIYLMFGIAASSAIAIYAWNHPRARGKRSFVLGIVASCLWMIGSLIGRWSTGFAGQYIGEVVRCAGITTLPVWVFAFTRNYCGQLVSFRLLRALLVVPSLSFLIMVTTLWTNLFFVNVEVGVPGPLSFDGLAGELGPYFWWVHMPYSYGLMTLNLLLVANQIGRVPRAFRGQICYLLVAMSVPLLIDAAGLFGFWEGYHTEFSIPVFPVLMGLAMFRHDFLGVNPVAYESIIENISDGVIVLDRKDIVVGINAAAARDAGRPPREIIGKSLSEVFADWKELLFACRGTLELTEEIARSGAPDGAAESALETRYFLLHIANLRGIDGQTDARTLTLRDVTDTKNYQASLETLAYYDPLTRLANRRRFGEEVEKQLQLAARAKDNASGAAQEFAGFAILYFDLNRFKAVNDTLGHEIGDELLKWVSARASEVLRAPDFVARLGGDEFVVLLHQATPHDIAPVVSRLMEHIQQPLMAGGHLLLPQLSLGMAFYPHDGGDLKALLRHADAAMYEAKAHGGGYNALPTETLPPLRLVEA